MRLRRKKRRITLPEDSFCVFGEREKKLYLEGFH